MKNYNFYVYIIASRSRVIYIGVTNDIIRRIEEHRKGVVEGFTKKYRVKNLVFYEWFTDIKAAITREKQLKEWRRQWKIDLIEKDNPGWKDLYNELIGG